MRQPGASFCSASPPRLCVVKQGADRRVPLCRAGQMHGLEGPEQLVLVPIFAALPPEQQAKVFEAAPPGSRKVRTPVLSSWPAIVFHFQL